MIKEERIKKALAQINQFKIPEWKKKEIIEVFCDYEGLRADLIKAGYPDELDYPNTTDYIAAIKPIPDNFVEIVTKWIPKLKYKIGIVNYLRETKNKYDGRILIPIFRESDKQGRWQICDAIEHNPPLNINDWIKEIYLDRSYGYSETGLLPLAIIKMFSRDEAREILKQGFDLHYRVTPEAFGTVGTLEDIPFLEEKLKVNYDASHVRKDIKKAIQKIQKREK